MPLPAAAATQFDAVAIAIASASGILALALALAGLLVGPTELHLFHVKPRKESPQLTCHGGGAICDAHAATCRAGNSVRTQRFRHR